MKIDIPLHQKKIATISTMQNDRNPFWYFWRELADNFLPKRYVWLQTDKERRIRNAKNPNILDSTGTTCARVLASGMMNGVTSPARPWFSLRIAGFDEATANDAVRIWCEEVSRRMLLTMAESNFYNCMAVLYLDLVVFGTGAMLIYEDYDSIIRCYNPALGEYYLAQDSRLQVNTFAREFTYKVRQVVERWGEENCSDTVKNAYKMGGAHLQNDVKITHLVEPNDTDYGSVPKRFAFRETYWETGGTVGTVLDESGFNEIPGVFPRWELTANDSYGTSPAMDALGDVIQLQHETKRKAQGIDKMISPPVVADVQLQNRPTALMPGGVTYIAGANNVGAKALYQITAPLGEMTLDIQQVRNRIGEVMHNPLFNMISQLDTVRSATEIDARREEKLVLLGSVLERFENEALDPAINRIYSVMNRMGLLPEPPPEIADLDIEIQYVSILSTAQRAIGAAPLERLLGLVGNIAPIAPQVIKTIDWDTVIRDYGADIGVKAKNFMSREAVAASNEEEAAQLEAQQAAIQGEALIGGAKQLSETEVGGGANALQALLGG